MVNMIKKILSSPRFSWGILLLLALLLGLYAGMTTLRTFDGAFLGNILGAIYLLFAAFALGSFIWNKNQPSKIWFLILILFFLLQWPLSVLQKNYFPAVKIKAYSDI